MFFENSCIFAEFPLDPCDSLRGEAAALARLKEHPDSKYIGYLNGDVLLFENHDIHFIEKFFKIHFVLSF